MKAEEEWKEYKHLQNEREHIRKKEEQFLWTENMLSVFSSEYLISCSSSVKQEECFADGSIVYTIDVYGLSFVHKPAVTRFEEEEEVTRSSAVLGRSL